MNAYDEGLKQRIAEIVEKKSQAEVARLTETTRTNVSRYLRGRRVPASFCGALVDKLGVNPAWLMTGEGAPLLSDTAKSTEYLAGDMLELVKAMNSVSRMRLGALAGKEHLKTLRELNENLERYRELKQTIGKRANPVLKQLLDDMEKAIDGEQFETADQRIAAAQEIQELCDDEALHIRFDELKAKHFWKAGRTSEARAIVRRLYARYLPETDSYNENFYRCAWRLSATLQGEGRLREARGIIRATAALAEELGAPANIRLRLMEWHALLNRGMGDLRPAVAILQEACATLPANEQTRAALAELCFLAGNLPFESALIATKQVPDLTVQLLQYATAAEDGRLLRAALKTLDPESERSDVLHARRVLNALDRERVQVAPPDTDDARLTALQNAVRACQLARLQGQRAKALEALNRARKMIESLGPDQIPDLYTRVVHHRSILMLASRGSKGERAGRACTGEAHAFFHDCIERGYNAFRPLVERAGDSMK